MSADKLSKDWLKKNGHKLKTIYSYAVVHKLNIKSVNDVLSILKEVDPDNATNENAEVYLKMLQLFSLKIKKTIIRRQKLN